MSGSFPAKAALAVSFGLLVASSAPRVSAQTRSQVTECIADFDRAQKERSDGQLRAARASANRCINSSCPAPIRKDCESLADALGRAIPTFIFRVRDPSDADVVDASITLDGAVMPSAVDGRAREIDPGPHEVVARASGFEPARVKVVAEEGVHPRIVELRLQPSAASEKQRPSPTRTETPPRTEPKSGTWAASGGLAAVGVIGLGLFAGLGLDADADYRHLRDTCRDACAKGDIDSVRTRFQIADVALATGAVALTAAAIVYLVGPRRPITTTVGVRF